MNFINMIRMRHRQKSMFEVLKFLLGVSLGFTIRTIFDLPSLKDSCPKCTVCEESRELQISDLHFQLREPFKPVSVDDVLQFDYFNMSTTVGCSDDEPLEGLRRHQKANIKDLVRQMLPLFNSAKGGQVWKMQKLINGYKRLDPLRGEEYIVDAIFASEKDESVSERHLLELVKPFGVVHLVKNELLDDEKMIHFILPISGAGPEFHQFLKTFEYTCLKNEEPVYLLVLLFSEEGVDIGSEYEKVKLAVSELTQNYRKAHIRIIHTKRIFSSALALDLGSKQLPPSTLMFFVNPYLTFTRDVLGRCRTNTIEHQLIYYPIVFGQYRPNTVKLYSDDAVEGNSFASISRHTGLFLFRFVGT